MEGYASDVDESENTNLPTDPHNNNNNNNNDNNNHHNYTNILNITSNETLETELLNETTSPQKNIVFSRDLQPPYSNFKNLGYEDDYLSNESSPEQQPPAPNPSRKASMSSLNSKLYPEMDMTPQVTTKADPQISAKQKQMLRAQLATEYLQNKTQRNYNEEFQSLVERPVETPESLRETTLAISKLSTDFVKSATPIVKKIIEERHLPIDQKTIKPANVGGIAGGEKYIMQGMFFKYALDKNNLYGKDEYAQKSARHELKSLLAIISARIDNLHTPLMALIDYKGFTIIVTSILPINNDTLVYGSADGGKTIFKSDERVNKMMSEVARTFNLKPHAVGTSKIVIDVCADIEVHAGFDGRIYILDTARLFPPQTPSRELRSTFLFRLFRMEFLKRYWAPLSSDAFSSFQTENKQTNNRHCIQATEHLFDIIIPQFVTHFDSLSFEVGSESQRLAQELHSHGINIRFLNLVFLSSTNSASRRVLFTEMVSRTVVKILQERMRLIPGLSPELKFKEMIVEGLNSVIDSQSEEYWSSTLKEQILTRFGAFYQSANHFPICEFRVHLFQLHHFFDLVTRKLGLKWEPESITNEFIQSADLF